MIDVKINDIQADQKIYLLFFLFDLSRFKSCYSNIGDVNEFGFVKNVSKNFVN